MPTEYSQAMNQYAGNSDIEENAMEYNESQAQEDIKQQPKKHLPLLVAFKTDKNGNIVQVTDLRVLTKDDFERLVRLYGQKKYVADGKTAAQLIVDGLYDTTYGVGIGFYLGGKWFLPKAVYEFKKILNFLTLGFFSYVQPLIVKVACSTKNATMYVITEKAAPLCKKFVKGFTGYFASKNNKKKTAPQPAQKKYGQPTLDTWLKK